MTLGTALRLGGLGCLALFIAALHLHSQPALLASVLLAVALAIVKGRSLATDRRPTLCARAAPHLEPGETVQAAFPAVSGPGPHLMLIVAVFCVLLSLLGEGRLGAGLMMLSLSYTTQWSIIATDRAILLLKSIRGRDADVLVTRLPRNTRLGPVSGRWTMISPNGTWMFVHQRCRAEIELADSAIAPRELVAQSEAVPNRKRPTVSLRHRDRGHGP